MRDQETLTEKIKRRIKDVNLSAKAKESYYGPKEFVKKDGKDNVKLLEIPRNVQRLPSGKVIITTDKVDKDDDIYVGTVINNTKEKEEEQKEKNPKSKLRLIPIIAIVPIFIGLHGCQAEQVEYVPETSSYQYVMYDTENPTIAVTGLDSQAHQEASNNNEKNGQSAFHGDYYDSDVAYEEEKIAAQDAVTYEELKTDIKEQASELKEDLSGIDVMISDTEAMSEIYQGKSKLVDSSLESFIENTNIYPDDNTEMEVQAAQIIAEDFHREEGKVQKNLEQLQELQSVIQQEDVKVNVDSVNIDDVSGDITISGETVKMVAETRKYTGIKAAEINIRKFFDNLKQNKTNQQQQINNVKTKENIEK